MKRFLVPGEDEGTFTFRDTPCPFLSGNRCTVYESRPDDCRSFSHLQKEGFVYRTIQAADGLFTRSGVFHVLPNVSLRPLEELFRPDKNFQLVRYYGWYTNKMRGQREKRAAEREGVADEESVEVIDVSVHQPRRIPPKKWRD